MWLVYAVAGMLTIGTGDFAIAVAGRRVARQREVLSISCLQHLTSLLTIAVT